MNEKALKVLQYVSRGRGYVDIEPYPDAAAREALGELRSTEADELSRLRDENQRFRNGYDNLLNALQNAPGLPLEIQPESALAEWTDILAGILMALGTLDSTGKPQSPWEALCAIADSRSAPEGKE